MTYDVVVVGAGIVGLAAARAILQRHAVRLVVLDKEPQIGRHQTGHNSGVLHSGIYYAPGSLKAQLCVAGAARLARYCEERGLPYERIGKLIVATGQDELARLHELHRRGAANGVPGLEMVERERMRDIEPAVVGVRALWSPNTAIVDFSAVAEAYAADVRERGAEICLRHQVVAMQRSVERTALETTAGVVQARRVVLCAGLYSDRLAAMAGGSPTPRIVPFRGDYYVLRPERSQLVRRLIYPVPDPSFPFLGVHFTPRPNGEVWLGPNAVLAFAREGYRRRDLVPGDLLEALSFRGFQRLAARYWRTGLAELWRDLSKRAFLASLRAYIPELEPEDLLPGPSGVRAQALSEEGALVDDFVVNRVDGMLHVRNAPSPAATSSLAIGDLIADAYDEMS